MTTEINENYEYDYEINKELVMSRFIEVLIWKIYNESNTYRVCYRS